MGKTILDGNVIFNGDPLSVKVVEAIPSKIVLGGNVIDEEHPLAVAVIGGQSGGIESLPPSGKCKVTNLYVDPETGKMTVEYDTGGA